MDKAVDIAVDSYGDIRRMSDAVKRAGAVLEWTASGAVGPASTVSRETVQSQLLGAVHVRGDCTVWHSESSGYGFFAGDFAHTAPLFRRSYSNSRIRATAPTGAPSDVAVAACKVRTITGYTRAGCACG